MDSRSVEDFQQSAIDFLRLIEPELHGTIMRHAPGYSDDGLTTRFSGFFNHELIQSVPDEIGFWEECLGCTAKKILDNTQGNKS